ncbi:MAG: hypothetical protein K2I93_02900 [Oscillospiraceae bacterium]|nr:hypothetical protein [Oscillospiraceae bacterium]
MKAGETLKIALILVSILLFAAAVTCVLMVLSIRTYHKTLDEQRSRIKKLTKQCQEADDHITETDYRAQTDPTQEELEHLRKENAELIERLSNEDKIKRAFLILRDRCQNYEAAIAEQEGIDTNALMAELTRVKHAYAQLLTEHRQTRDALDKARTELLLVRAKPDITGTGNHTDTEGV